MNRIALTILTLFFIATGQGALAEAEEEYIYIKATSQSEGNLDLSDGTNWNTSKSIIRSIRLDTSSTDWDLVLYPDDDFDELGTFPSQTLVKGASGNKTILLDLSYSDEDGTDEVHLKYTDNSGTNTADIYIIGVRGR